MWSNSPVVTISVGNVYANHEYVISKACIWISKRTIFTSSLLLSCQICQMTWGSAAMDTALTCWRNWLKTWVSPLTFTLLGMGSTGHWAGRDAGRGWSGTCWAERLTWPSPLFPSTLPGAESSISPHPSTPPAWAFWYKCLKSSLVFWSLYFNDGRGDGACSENILHLESVTATQSSMVLWFVKFSLSSFFSEKFDNLVWKYIILSVCSTHPVFWWGP